MQPETVTIEAYSLFEFCQKVQDAIKQGYEFDFTKNETVPVAMGSYLFAIMRLAVDVIEPEPEVKTEVVKEQQAEVKTEVVKEQQAEVKTEVSPTRGRPRSAAVKAE